MNLGTLFISTPSYLLCLTNDLTLISYFFDKGVKTGTLTSPEVSSFYKSLELISSFTAYNIKCSLANKFSYIVWIIA